MHCLENIKRISYPADLVMDLTRLYRFKGKDFYYEDVLKNQMDKIVSETIYKDTVYASKLLELNVSEHRLNLLILKDSNPKTNDEKIISNLKRVFTIIQDKGEELDLVPNEFLALADLIFKGIVTVGFRTAKVEVQFNLLKEKKTVSMREDFEKMLNLYKSCMKKKEVEATQVQSPEATPDDSMLSESLAKIYIKQHKYSKAYEIIRNLSLNFPEKSIYFADQLRFLQKLIINQRYIQSKNNLN